MPVQIRDANSVTRDIKTIERASVHTQVLELESVTPYVNLDLQNTGVVVTGAKAQLHSWEVFNSDTEPLYVKLYDKATQPTSGDTPIRVWEVMPGNAPFQGGVVNGIAFANGIGIRCTKGRAHADNTAPTANTCLINLGHRAG